MYVDNIHTHNICACISGYPNLKLPVAKYNCYRYLRQGENMYTHMAILPQSTDVHEY